MGEACWVHQKCIGWQWIHTLYKGEEEYQDLSSNETLLTQR